MKKKKKKKRNTSEVMESVCMYVNPDSNEQDRENTEVDDGVNQNGYPTGTHVPELHHPCPCRYLKQQSRWQQDE